MTNFINNSLRPNSPYYNRQVENLAVTGSQGESFYSAGFVSLVRRFSSGLQFSLNYTLSRTLDQYGQAQEATGVLSNPYDLATDWGPALFDRTHVVNTNYFYELPFGKGQRFGNSNPAASRIFGGWYVSGVLTGSSGFPLLINQHAQAFGGSQIFTGIAPGMIPIGAGFDYSATINANHKGTGSAGVNADPARRGSGMNIFADPQAVLASVRHVRIGEDGRHGRGIARGLKRFNYDASIGKRTAITEGVRLVFSLDMINALNRVEFADPSTSYFTPASFGVISGQWADPRQIQFGLRFEF